MQIGTSTVPRVWEKIPVLNNLGLAISNEKKLVHI